MAAKRKKAAGKIPAPKRGAGKTKETRREELLKSAKEAVAAAKRNAKVESVGALVCGRILEGKMSTEEIAAEARKRCKSETTPAVVYWHRGNLKSLGVKLPASA